MQKDSYKTPDYGLAAWLCYRRCTLLGAVKIGDNPKMQLLFIYADNLDDFVDEWNAGESDEAQVCQKFFARLNTVKHAIRNHEQI